MLKKHNSDNPGITLRVSLDAYSILSKIAAANYRTRKAQLDFMIHEEGKKYGLVKEHLQEQHRQIVAAEARQRS